MHAGRVVRLKCDLFSFGGPNIVAGSRGRFVGADGDMVTADFGRHGVWTTYRENVVGPYAIGSRGWRIHVRRVKAGG